MGRRLLGMPCVGAQEVVCGDDGKTYFNSCDLEEAGADKECQGSCPCKESGEGIFPHPINFLTLMWCKVRP